MLDILVPILYFLNDARADQCEEGRARAGRRARGKGPFGEGGGPASPATSQELRTPRPPPPQDGPCPGAPLLPSPLCGDPAHAPCAARVGLMHIGVFILLLLSGERNFGVRLNKPYSVRVPMDIPVFTGTHADLLIVVRGPPGAWGGLSLETEGTPWPPSAPRAGVPQDHHQRAPAAAAALRLPAHHRGQR